MTVKRAGKWYLILAILGILFAGIALAEEETFVASITIIDLKPFDVPDFTINGERFYDAVRQGKKVKLPFRDMKEIRFLNPGKSFQVEVLFNDGRRETLLLQPAADIVIETGMISEYSHSKVARIQFAPTPAQPFSPAPLPAQRQPGLVGTPLQSDRIALRNGDSLSGQIQMKILPLRTAYGTFQIEVPQIVSIEFDASRPELAVVLLRNGDRLSGAVEVESVRLTMASGEGATFGVKTIQKIFFKR